MMIRLCIQIDYFRPILFFFRYNESMENVYGRY